MAGRVASLAGSMVEAGFSDFRVLIHSDGSGFVAEAGDVAVEWCSGCGWEVSGGAVPVVQSCSGLDEAIELAAEAHGEVLL